MYRDRLKGVQILLSNSQAGPGRKVKQEQEEISRNHVQAFQPISVNQEKLSFLVVVATVGRVVSFILDYVRTHSSANLNAIFFPPFSSSSSSTLSSVS